MVGQNTIIELLIVSACGGNTVLRVAYLLSTITAAKKTARQAFSEALAFDHAAINAGFDFRR
jgi:hypothetical protein